jgi:DNA-binding MarR family transcriptional regulator
MLQYLSITDINLNNADISMSRAKNTEVSRQKVLRRKVPRQQLLNRLWDLGRVMSTQTVFLHQALAQSVGLNATDTKCIDLILRSPDGMVTAGRLSDITGLTSGAITHILDRLEKREFIERVRDQQDRRKVFIRVRPETLEPLTPRYEAIGRAYQKLAEEYSDEQLQLFTEYLERIIEISDRELARVIAENKAG